MVKKKDTYNIHDLEIILGKLKYPLENVTKKCAHTKTHTNYNSIIHMIYSNYFAKIA
jgi:hypothetical protein